MKKIDIDIAIDSFAAETIDIAIAIENFWGDNWYCHWPKNSTIAHVWSRVAGNGTEWEVKTIFLIFVQFS